MPNPNLTIRKDKLSCLLHESLYVFSNEKHRDSAYKFVSLLINQLQQSPTEADFEKCCKDFNTYLKRSPDLDYLQATMEAFLTTDPTAVKFDEFQFLAKLQRYCSLAQQATETSLDFSKLLEQNLMVNQLAFDNTWTKNSRGLAKFWRKSTAKDKPINICNKFRNYLYAAGVLNSYHHFIYHFLSSNDIHCLIEDYLYILRFKLQFITSNHKITSIHTNSYHISTHNSQINVSQTVKMEYINQHGNHVSFLVIVKITFDHCDNPISPQLINFQIETTPPQSSVKMLFDQLTKGRRQQYFKPSGKLSAGNTLIDCTAYLAQLQHRKISAVLINNAYCLVRLPHKMNDEQYYLIDLNDLIGRGAFGKVYQAYKVDINNPIVNSSCPHYAAKIVLSNTFSSSEISYTIPYMMIQGSVQVPHDYKSHDQLDKIKGITRIVTIMEMIPGKTINAKTLNQLNLTLLDRLRMVLQLVLQVQNFHESTISSQVRMIHCDLKPDNVLFYQDKQGKINCRIIDYGYADTAIDGAKPEKVQRHSNTDFIGNFFYCAPEMLRRECSMASDIYMLAPIIALILGEHQATKNKIDYSTKHSISRKSTIKQKFDCATQPLHFSTILRFPGFYNKSLRSKCIGFLSRMSEIKRKRRPPIGDVVRFFTDLKNEIYNDLHPSKLYHKH